MSQGEIILYINMKAYGEITIQSLNLAKAVDNLK